MGNLNICFAYKRTIQNILKLGVNSSPSVVYFVAGSLPGAAILELKQLSLFGMVCRLLTNPINFHAKQILLSASASHSWFGKVRDLLLKYQLPHPLDLLHSPPTKECYKKLIKSKVIDFWETKLRAEAPSTLSLPYFHPEYLSLGSPHKILTSAGAKSYEVSKARIQLLFMTSQYPSAKFSRHWSPENPLGICSNGSCKEYEVIETSEHILLYCPAYNSARQNAIKLCLQIKNQHVHQLVTNFFLTGPHKLLQFLLDCSVIPEVISMAQQHGNAIYNDLFYLGRTWCFGIHRMRMKRLCKWNFR